MTCLTKLIRQSTRTHLWRALWVIGETTILTGPWRRTKSDAVLTTKPMAQRAVQERKGKSYARRQYDIR